MRQSRILFVVAGASPKQLTYCPVTRIPAVVAADSHQIATIDSLVASLESQATADTAHKVDIEMIYQLLSHVADLPDEDLPRLMQKYERPSVADRTQYRRLYVGKTYPRRTRRRQARANKT